MAFTTDLLAEHGGLSTAAVEHLQLLVEDWQIVADLSFADLLLFVRHRLEGGGRSYLAVAQIRPHTTQTIYADDLVGHAFEVGERPMVTRAFDERRIIRDADPDWSTGVPVREEAVPVSYNGEVIAVVTREANISTARAPSQLELTYLQCANELARMMAQGSFPYHAGPRAGEREVSPRVGDGIARLDPEGTVVYASPNAISSYRRLGVRDNVVGSPLVDIDPEGGPLIAALAQGWPSEAEIERAGAIVMRRVLPLEHDGRVVAGLLLAREVTELRRHERALRVKDATIREIHHRVGNNLQTVASLLRLQTRRLASEEARDALRESVRRISSIAVVHQTLSQESQQRVDFGEVAQRIVAMLGDGLVHPEVPIALSVHGEPGDLASDVATPLALVLSELVQNGLEHAFGVPEHPEGGQVQVHFERGPSTLRVLVTDDGAGLSDGSELTSMSNLGLQIARTLVDSELGGSFALVEDDPAALGGATFELVVPLA